MIHLKKLNDLVCAEEYAVAVSNRFNVMSFLEGPVELWDTFKRKTVETAKELAILIAEVEEYRSIMKQFPQTQQQVRILHEESTQHSATLTGKITAITKTIDLLQSEAT